MLIINERFMNHAFTLFMTFTYIYNVVLTIDLYYIVCYYRFFVRKALLYT